MCPALQQSKTQIRLSSVSSFSWEEVAVHSRGVSSFRLLAVGSQCDLKLLEVEAERSASISLLRVSECPADGLLQTVREQDHGEFHDQPTITRVRLQSSRRGLTCSTWQKTLKQLWCFRFMLINIINVSLFSDVCELQSLRVLSFAAGHCYVLLNCDWLLQLQWQQMEEEPQTLSCCNIQLTDSNRHTAVHHCVCRETLFILSSSGLICILHWPQLYSSISHSNTDDTNTTTVTASATTYTANSDHFNNNWSSNEAKLT